MPEFTKEQEKRIREIIQSERDKQKDSLEQSIEQGVNNALKPIICSMKRRTYTKNYLKSDDNAE